MPFITRYAAVVLVSGFSLVLSVTEPGWRGLALAVVAAWAALSGFALDLTLPVALIVGPVRALRLLFWALRLAPGAYLRRMRAEAREHIAPRRLDDKAATGGEISLAKGPTDA